MRRSIDPVKKREIVNTKLQDVCSHRVQKDIMAASVTDSLANTGTFQKSARRTNPKFAPRRTGEIADTHEGVSPMIGGPNVVM